MLTDTTRKCDTLSLYIDIMLPHTLLFPLESHWNGHVQEQQPWWKHDGCFQTLSRCCCCIQNSWNCPLSVFHSRPAKAARHRHEVRGRPMTFTLGKGEGQPRGEGKRNLWLMFTPSSVWRTFNTHAHTHTAPPAFDLTCVVVCCVYKLNDPSTKTSKLHEAHLSVYTRADHSCSNWLLFNFFF